MSAQPRTASTLSRRTLLAASAGLALTALAGCDRATTAPPPTVRTLLAEKPFYLGSRASARDWPEMTAFAFEQAAEIPDLQAMELSVCRTSDGVLVCSAEPNLKRVTGHNVTILKQTWADLSTLQVTAAETRDPTQPARPLARLEEILERYTDRFVFFLEPVVKQAYGNLMAAMLSTQHPDRLVWKEPVNSPRFADVKRHGISTWGYVLNEPAHLGDNLKQFAADESIDLIGVSITNTDLLDQVVRAATSNHKPAIAWNIRGRDDLVTVVNTGFTGVASLSIQEILGIKLPTPGSTPNASPSISK